MLEKNLLEAQTRLRSRIQELVIPLFVFIVSAFGVLVYGVWQSVQIQDEIEIGNSERLFAALISDQKQKFERFAFDNSYWDAALKNLVLKLNSDWANDNIGPYLIDLHDLSGSYVISTDNQTIYSSVSSKDIRRELLNEFPDFASPLKEIRNNFVLAEKKSAKSFISQNYRGELYLISAAVLQADGVELPTDIGAKATDQKYLLVLTKKIDELFLSEIAKRFSLPDIKLVNSLPTETTELASYIFVQTSAPNPIWAVWRPKLSSGELVVNVAKNTSIIFGCLMLLMIVIGFRALRLKRIIDKGIRDYLEEKKILQQYESAIRDLGQGPTLFDLDVNEAFAKISKYAVNTLKVDEIGLWEFDVDTRYMINVSCYENQVLSSKIGTMFELDAFPELDQIFDEGFPFYTENIQSEPLLENVARVWFDISQPTALLIIPVRRYGVARGFVHFAVMSETFPWSEEKIRFASSLVDFVSLNFDIQDQKEIERQLRIAKNAAEKANASKTDFLSNMSHELRTPLNAIIGFSDLIKQGIFGPLGAPQYQAYVDDINLSARHLLGLISEILEIAKTESGTYRIHPTEIDLKTEIATCLKLLEGRFQDKKYDLKVEISDALKTVIVDPNAFRKILLNLLTNSVKFTLGNAQISLKIEDLSDHIKIVVDDNGIGISRVDLKSIFDPFTQAENTLSKRFEGTGLGLSITKALIELHGGKIEIQSVFGKGTTVTVQLPKNIEASLQNETVITSSENVPV